MVVYGPILLRVEDSKEEVASTQSYKTQLKTVSTHLMKLLLLNFLSSLMMSYDIFDVDCRKAVRLRRYSVERIKTYKRTFHSGTS